ncbi:MAG: dimethyl sulfoxide reductase anchor subunit [Acidisphaera sp.]|nr:dimethyl sulfoxide reductase anchor subunit [Acidisphaera sp.]
MNPSLSVIFFTTASGAGYGMLTWLGLLAPFGWLPPGRGFALAALAIALLLVTAGLLSSMAHLGRPGRAWRAFSQWRSSWLSREGVASVLTYIPAGLFGLAWLIAGRPGPPALACGLATAAMAVLTVCCTGMIYASLRPIRQWHNGYVLPLYLLLSLFSGAVCLAAPAGLAGRGVGVLAVLAVLSGAAALALKLLYWRYIDTAAPISTPESATGLGPIGRVRSLEWPHTEENYLLREMGFRIARKHAARLRAIALLATFALPLLLGIIGVVLPEAMPPGVVLAAFCALAGLFIERWLFFAEATHTVTLYYGRA